ncbi:DUF6538 domain-containing protein [Magnetovirga frankeli]
MAYLQRHPSGVCYYRRRIPAACQHAFETREVFLSLRTRDWVHANEV